MHSKTVSHEQRGNNKGPLAHVGIDYPETTTDYKSDGGGDVMRCISASSHQSQTLDIFTLVVVF